MSEARRAPVASLTAPQSLARGHTDVGKARGFRLVGLSIGALGVVYGDIGTSPLYALRECFVGAHAVAPTLPNVLGVLSLFFWSLLIVVVVKYLGYMLRADNHGEGGILALLALIIPSGGGRAKPKQTRRLTLLVLLGLLGAALLFADGAITPAISVLSAVEGLSVATTKLTPFVVPITIGILVALFLVQRFGTAKVGAVFGPLTFVWFAAISASAAPWILREPRVLRALNPYYGAMFFVDHGFHAFVLLGAVVLCVTGGEALYADMGHFGRRAIRIAWFTVVYPALLLSYFGQGALLIARGRAVVSNPFFALVSEEWLFWMVGIATIATIVASQALISGAYSLARQAVQLGFFPRVRIIHTSGGAEGQIYVPEVNSLLMVACIGLVIGFGSSSALAAAYGTAVTGTMTITSILFYAAMRDRLGRGRVLRAVLLFLVFDVAFLASNALKIEHGGWFPIVTALGIFTIMTTWNRGRLALGAYVMALARPLAAFMEEIQRNPPVRVKGTAIFMTANPGVAPPVLLHHLKHNQVLHERVILLTIVSEGVPEIAPAKRLVVHDKGAGLVHITAHYGFMQSPNVPEILERCAEHGIRTQPQTTTFYLGRETLLATGTSKLARWRKRLFAFLSRNSRPPTDFFQIPPDRVVEMGMQVQL